MNKLELFARERNEGNFHFDIYGDELRPHFQFQSSLYPVEYPMPTTDTNDPDEILDEECHKISILKPSQEMYFPSRDKEAMQKEQETHTKDMEKAQSMHHKGLGFKMEYLKESVPKLNTLIGDLDSMTLDYRSQLDHLGSDQDRFEQLLKKHKQVFVPKRVQKDKPMDMTIHFKSME